MQAATQEALESGENPTHTRSFSLMRVYRRSSMCMLVTTSDSTPTLMGLQARDGDFSPPRRGLVLNG